MNVILAARAKISFHFKFNYLNVKLAKVSRTMTAFIGHVE